jgi:ribosomal protein L33
MTTNCEYAEEVSPLSNKCGLKLYLGKIAKSSCEKCIQKKFNDPVKNKTAHEEMRRAAHERAAWVKESMSKKRESLSLSRAVKGAASTALAWVRSGLKATPPSILEERIRICKTCELWDSTGFRNTGRCRKCGCSTWAKLRMGSAKCPIEKW